LRDKVSSSLPILLLLFQEGQVVAEVLSNSGCVVKSVTVETGEGAEGAALNGLVAEVLRQLGDINRLASAIVASRSYAPGCDEPSGEPLEHQFHAFSHELAQHFSSRGYILVDPDSLLAYGLTPDRQRTLVVSTDDHVWGRLVDRGPTPRIRSIPPDTLHASEPGRPGEFPVEDIFETFRGLDIATLPSETWDVDAIKSAGLRLRIILSVLGGTLAANRVIVVGSLVDSLGDWLRNVTGVRTAGGAEILFSPSTRERLRRGVVAIAQDASRSFDSAGVSSLAQHGFTTIRLVAPQKIDYSVITVNRPLSSAGWGLLDVVLDGEPAVLVVDQGVGEGIVDEIRKYASGRHAKTVVEEVPGGEKCKDVASVVALCQRAIEETMPRRSFMVGIGGGALLDMVGLAASLYRRGVRYVRVPTTLVGQIDVAVGIKHAVNLDQHKNIIGTFFPPVASINDLSFLNTLPLEEIRSGVAEMFKIALVRSQDLYELLSALGDQMIANRFSTEDRHASRALELASLVMMQELQPNLFEHSLERLPDFGHTFGPYLELPLKIRHGEAVALDIAISTCIAVDMEIADRSLRNRILEDMDKLGLPTWDNRIKTSQLEAALDSSSAHRAGKLNLVVPDRIGSGTFIIERSALSHHTIDSACRFLAARNKNM
jgi:3-dehydroquinate synthetase